MKLMRVSLTALALVLLTVEGPTGAAAQPSGGYGQPPPPPTIPGGFHDRAGMPFAGVSLGLGGMSIDDEEVTCPSCDYNPIGFEIDGHIGGMLSHNFALMLELQANAETVYEDSYGSASLVQGVAMISGQYWISPRLWVKGGIGLSHLSFEYDDVDYGSASEPVDDGAALMAAVGYELISLRYFALDAQARFITAGYDGIDDRVDALTVGIGLSWFGFWSGGGGAVIVVH
jgi:hypothetical protein